VLAMLDEKSKGKEVTVSAPALQRDGKIVDIMEALKRSMERIPAKKKPALAGAAKKKKRVISQKQTDLTIRVLLLVSPSTIGGTGVKPSSRPCNTV
jgi:hypothetical protein